MGRRASSSVNPLAKPTSPIYALAARMQDYLHFPDPTPLYAVMGTMAANMITGNPVWLMLIGPPSCGGTILLNSLGRVPRVHSVSTIQGPSVLLSGVSKKDRAKDATGGLLRQVGEKGAIVIKDFTSILSMPHEPLLQTLGALREVYDGAWSRQVGSDGGRVLTWEGKVAMLAKSTNALDRHHGVINDMGERWVFYRYPESDGWGESKRALSIKDPEQAKEDMQVLVEGFFDGLGLDWEDRPKRTLKQEEWTRIISIATLAARCRSAVVRNSYTKEIEDVPQAELPTRLATVMGQLYLGMETIGLEPRERWEVVGKVAMDCMPQARQRVLDSVRVHVGSTSTSKGIGASEDELVAAMKMSRSTVKRVVEDMEIHGILDKVPGKRIWTLSGWAEQEIKQGWGV